MLQEREKQYISNMKDAKIQRFQRQKIEDFKDEDMQTTMRANER